MKAHFLHRISLFVAAFVFATSLSASARSTYSVSDITDDDVYNLLGNGIEHAPVFGPQNIFGGGDNQAGVQWFSGFDCVVAESDGSSFTVFPEGIVLSTGAAAAGISDDGKNNANNSPSHSWEGDVTDTDLAAVFGKSLVHDVAGVILYVTPSNRTLNIPLMVASEEYFLRSTTYSRPTLSTYQSFNDCFAFFVEPGHLPYSASDNLFTNNIAKLAGDIPLSIGSVNPYTNQTFFVANVDTSITNANGTVRLTFPSDNIPIPFQYNGVITGPCAVMTNAVPGQEYTLKIIVGDGGNARDVDTAVFIKAKGITSGADLNLTVTVDPESLPDVGDGDTATFTFKVENVGPAPAWGVTLTNAVPASPDGAWSWSAPEVWNLPDLASGASFTTNLVVSFTDLAAAYPGLTVTGVVATATGDYDMSNNSDSATVSFASTATVSATKVWADAGDQDGIRPSSVTFSLYANGSKVEDASVSAADGWAKTWSGLPKVDNGAPIAYDVREDAVPDDYSLSIVTNGLDFTLANTHTPATVAVTVQKVWDDANDQDGLRPLSVTFALSSNGVEVATASVSESTGWATSWEGLAERAAGTLIAYEVREDTVPMGYTAEITHVGDSWTVTNTHVPEPVDVTATKVWNDADDQDGLRPASATLSLYADGVKVEDFAATVATPSKTWTGLAKRAAGTLIAYEVREDIVPTGYTNSITHVGDVWTVTNTHEPETVDVTATKVWDDEDNRDGYRPASATLSLYADGVKREDFSATIGSLSKMWTGLAKRSAGTLITYEVREDSVPAGYTNSITHVGDVWTVTNTHEHDTIDIKVTKVWDDADNQDGIRPNSVDLTLHDPWGAVVQTVTAADNWTYTWTGLRKWAGPNVGIAYRVEEWNPPEGYTASRVDDGNNNWTVTNTHVPETVTVTATKAWDDADDQDGIRPASATLSLYADGVKVEDFAATVATPSKTWTGLAKRSAGTLIAYEVREDSVPAGYTNSITHVGDVWTVTNTHEPETVDVTATKAWNDADDQDGLRPESATLSLYADGVKVEDFAATVATPSKTWTGLAKRSAGTLIAYEVREDIVPTGYTAEITHVGDVWTVTNTHGPVPVEVTATKVWDDADDQDGLRPASATLSFYENGVWVEDFVATEAAPSKTWAGLPKYASGVEIRYEIHEDSVPAGYTKSETRNGNAWTITNIHAPETLSVSATNVWDDADNQDGKRPSSVLLSLYADGVKVEDFAATVATPSKTWTGLAKRSAGTLIAYEVREDVVPTGYTNSITHVGDVWTVTNTYVPETVDVTATKVWNDADDQDGLRPASATLSLYADGVKREDFSATIGSLSKTWAGLPKFSAGSEIVYDVREDSVPEHYSATVVRSGYSWTVTNTHVVGSPKLQVSVVWTLSRSDGLFHGSITVKNAGNLAFPLAANYWLATPGSRPTWYLYNPTGKLPDGSDYYNLTAAVQAAVKSVGNRNTVLDPGESVTVTGPLMYHKQRINPSKYLATTAFHAGTLLSPHDTNKDFKISASELSAAESKWKAGSVSDADVLLVSLLNASPAYLWSDSASSLVGCADKR